MCINDQDSKNMDNGLLQACLHKDHWTYFYWRIQYSEKIGRIFELQSVGGREENRKDFRAAIKKGKECDKNGRQAWKFINQQ